MRNNGSTTHNFEQKTAGNLIWAHNLRGQPKEEQELSALTVAQIYSPDRPTQHTKTLYPLKGYHPGLRGSSTGYLGLSHQPHQGSYYQHPQLKPRGLPFVQIGLPLWPLRQNITRFTQLLQTQMSSPHPKPQPQTLKPSNPQTLKPSNPQTLKPSNPQTLKPSNPQTLKPSNPQTLKPSNPQTLKPSNPQTLKPSNPQTQNTHPWVTFTHLCPLSCVIGFTRPFTSKTLNTPNYSN